MSNKSMEDEFDAMFTENDDVFDGLDDPDLQTFNRLPFFNEEKAYLLELDMIKFTKSTQNNNRFYHLEFTVLESDDERLPPGSQARHTITISGIAKFKDYGPAAFKQFLSELIDIPVKMPGLPPGFWKDLAIDSIKEGKVNGKKIRLRTVRNNNNPTFPFHNYSTYKE